ncbi:MAG: ABC transporter ATP-binding protein/permease, partial [Sandaracinaceae bacterium]|nr:ABC transporter ATP-binding protein/permease [Sandaracinaceae bacterium]
SSATASSSTSARASSRARASTRRSQGLRRAPNTVGAGSPTHDHAEGLDGNALEKSFWLLRVAWRAAPWVILTMAICTLLMGVLPAVVANVGRAIVDAVVHALEEPDGWATYKERLWGLIGLEAVLVSIILAATRGLSAAQAILKARLTNTVTDLILQKSLTLRLEHYEDPDIHDRLMRARRDAGTRPYNLVVGIFNVARNATTFLASIVVLAALSGWAVLIVIVAGLPVFIAELRFSQHAFDQQRKRSPQQREQAHLEQVVSREDYAKEVQLYQLGDEFMERLRKITKKIENEERSIALRRNSWGFVFNLVGTLAFYGAYAWIVHRAVNEHLSLGEMTMYIAIFRQAQGGVTSGLASLGLMLDDQLYLRDLQSFLSLPIAEYAGKATEGPDPDAGLVLENVSFTYADAPKPALDNVSFQIKPGEMVALVGQNGSGKTTLLKLITRLYEPREGRILLDGLDIREWDIDALRLRFALVFQDFARFKMTAGENIGAGDVDAWMDEERWERAGKRGLAHEFIAAMPHGYHSQLGKWFRGGTELSGGQWQKVALSRAFMREEDQIVVLDEPTAALDPDAEQGILEHVREIRGKQSVLLISHRFGSVRIADRILVLDRGRINEAGTHEQLMARKGLYQRLFQLQAAGYSDEPVTVGKSESRAKSLEAGAEA